MHSRKIYLCILLCISFFSLNLLAGDKLTAPANDFVLIHPARILDLNADLLRNHQGLLAGIPNHFDWALKPRLNVKRDFSNYRALTGWGQAFWNANQPYNSELVLQIKNFQTYVCFGDNHVWKQLQRGDVVGAQFNNAFKDNSSHKAQLQETVDGVISVKFDYGQIFHFWPKFGRADIPVGDIHGVVTLFEAKLLGDKNISNNSGTSPILIGGGADLWLSKTSQWDNFKTHNDVGIGRIKFVGPNWTFYGFSTASNNDLSKLIKEGYVK